MKFLSSNAIDSFLLTLVISGIVVFAGLISAPLYPMHLVVASILAAHSHWWLVLLVPALLYVEVLWAMTIVGMGLGALGLDDCGDDGEDEDGSDRYASSFGLGRPMDDPRTYGHFGYDTGRLPYLD
jgi:hypothetical protein